MKNAKLLRIVAGIILSTILVLFIGSYFQLELPLAVLWGTLKSNLLIALVAGVVMTLIAEWATKKTKSS